jgi:hypothetical protein
VQAILTISKGVRLNAVWAGGVAGGLSGILIAAPVNANASLL